MIANKECYERGCACYDSRVDGEGIKVVAEREWVGLTDEEKKGFWTADQMTQKEWDELFNAIEAKLKEKNSDHRN